MSCSHCSRPVLLLCVAANVLITAAATAPSHGSSPPARGIEDGLLAHYELDGTAADSSANAYHGVVNGAAFGTGRIGQAAVFDGFDDTVTVPGLAAASLVGDVTVAFWIWPDGWSGSWQGPVAKRGLTEPGADFGVNVNSSIGLQWYFGTGSSFTIMTMPAPPPAATWTHVAGVRSGNTLELYYDGSYVGASTFGTVPQSANVPVTIGATAPGLEPFGGAIDDLRIYNRALAGNEVVELYDLAFAATPTPTATATPTGSPGVPTSTATPLPTTVPAARLAITSARSTSTGIALEWTVPGSLAVSRLVLEKDTNTLVVPLSLAAALLLLAATTLLYRAGHRRAAVWAALAACALPGLAHAMQAIELAPGDRSYLDTNVAIGETYWYRVNVNNGAYYSEQVGVTYYGAGQVSPEALAIDSETMPLSSVDGTVYTFTFSGGAPPVDIQPGSVIAGDQDGGFLRRVVAVSIIGSTVQVETSDVALEEVVELGGVNGIIHLDPEQAIFRSFVPGIVSSPAGVDLSGTLIYEGTVTDEAGNKLYLKLEIPSGRVEFAPDLDFGLAIASFRVSSFHAIARGRLDFSADYRLTLGAQAERAVFQKALWTQTYPPQVVGAIGPVPVVVVPTLTFYFLIEASANGSVAHQVGGDLSYGVEAGARYDGQSWQGIWNTATRATAHPWSGEIRLNATAKASFKPELSLKIYGVAGPAVNAAGGIRFDAGVRTADPPWFFELYAAAEGKAVMDASMLGDGLRYEHTLFSRDWLLLKLPADTPTPTSTPTATPTWTPTPTFTPTPEVIETPTATPACDGTDLIAQISVSPTALSCEDTLTYSITLSNLSDCTATVSNIYWDSVVVAGSNCVGGGSNLAPDNPTVPSGQSVLVKQGSFHHCCIGASCSSSFTCGWRYDITIDSDIGSAAASSAPVTVSFDESCPVCRQAESAGASRAPAGAGACEQR